MRDKGTMRAGLVLLILPFAGCGDSEILPEYFAGLTDAQTYELLSLDPRELDPSVDDLSPDRMFHGFGVLGRVNIADHATRARINVALQSGARDFDGAVAACFNPRHGLRVVRDGVTTDYVICFECAQVKIYTNHEQSDSYGTAGTPQAAFDEVLVANHIPLPRKAE